jgi:putative ABC transport system ATP-binding protein
MIRAEKLRQVYTMGSVELEVLHQVSLQIEAGEFVAVTGPSGGGKSTLMNILGCLDRPVSGNYFLGEHEVSTLNDDALAAIRNQMIGFVFQSFNLLPKNTALENVEMPLLYAGASGGRARAIEALERVGLGDRMGHLPSQMSGGQRQRVAIARAIVMTPPLLLADEPTGNLDTKTGDEIMAIFQKLNRAGTTIVLVTHEPDIAVHAGRVLFLRDGHIERDERTGTTPKNFPQHPPANLGVVEAVLVARSES